MENPEKLTTLCTRYRTKITKLTIQKAEKMSNTNPTGIVKYANKDGM
jgi:hypothetical protein